MGTDPTRRLVLLRHGRTEWNLTRRAQGHADIPLDEVGHAQASAAAALLVALKPVRLWSSDLARALQTAEHVAAATGLPIACDARLREFAVGERQGLTHEESVALFPQIANGRGLGDRLVGVPGAETDEDVRARIVPAVEDCLADLAEGETGIVVTHGAALNHAVVGLLGWENELVKSLTVLGNCRWVTVAVSDGGRRRRLEAYGVGDFASMPGIG